MAKDQLDVLSVDIKRDYSAIVSILGRELNYSPYYPVVHGSLSMVNLGRIRNDMKEVYPDFVFPEKVQVNLSYPSDL